MKEITGKIAQRIKEKGVLVSDGAWGTQLQDMGLKSGECPELWCVDNRAKVLEVARSYVRAGADLIKTNSFGGTRFKLELYGLGARAAEINREAAAISREAAGSECLVIASMGPTGKMLAMGDVTEAELYDVFSEQAAALEQGGADACLVETMSALDEAALAVRAVRENTRLEALCTFTFERNVRGEYRTMMGVDPVEMAEAMTGAGAHLLGANCGNGMERMEDIVRLIRKAKPASLIVVHANAGLPANVGGKTVFPETPEITAGLVPRVVRAGASVVGGCCGTGPAHIAAIAGVVRNLAIGI